MSVTVKGKVFTGLSEGGRYTKLAWVRKQVKEKLGFNPYPGTLNLTLSSETRIGNLLSKAKGWEIKPEEGYFSGRFYRATVMRKVHAAVVRPEVMGYPENVLEIVAPICLREELRLKDDDEVEVEIWLE